MAPASCWRVAGNVVEGTSSALTRVDRPFAVNGTTASWVSAMGTHWRDERRGRTSLRANDEAGSVLPSAPTATRRRETSLAHQQWHRPRKGQYGVHVIARQHRIGRRGGAQLIPEKRRSGSRSHRRARQTPGLYGNHGRDPTGSESRPNAAGVTVANTVSARNRQRRALGVGNAISGNAGAGIRVQGAVRTLASKETSRARRVRQRRRGNDGRRHHQHRCRAHRRREENARNVISGNGGAGISCRATRRRVRV